ncbi:MAG TPA: thiamine pyrophosphate-dependent enzyme, partial [Thermoanaerobaculia bacterium]|nr:thiamine pyrophosphate-dependent enzyme [Thermoanaerobaculia bacterium]
MHGLLEDGLFDATAMKIRGPNIGNALHSRFLIGALNAIAIYALGAMMLGSAEAGIATYFFWQLTGSTFSLRFLPAMFTLALIAAAVRTRDRRYYLAAGVGVVVCGVTSLDFAAYTLIALLLAAWRGGGMKPALHGIAIAAVPLFLAFAIFGVFDDFFRGTFFEILSMGPAFTLTMFSAPKEFLEKGTFPDVVVQLFRGGPAYGMLMWCAIAIGTAVLLALPRRRRLEPFAIVGVWIAVSAISYAERHHLYYMAVMPALIVPAAWMAARRRSAYAPPIAFVLLILAMLTTHAGVVGWIRPRRVLSRRRRRDRRQREEIRRPRPAAARDVRRLHQPRAALLPPPPRQPAPLRRSGELRDRGRAARGHRRDRGQPEHPRRPRPPRRRGRRRRSQRAPRAAGLALPAAELPSRFRRRRRRVLAEEVMASLVASPPMTSLSSRFTAFIAERHPFALRPAMRAMEQAGFENAEAFRRALEPQLAEALAIGDDVPETTPGVSARERLQHAVAEVLDACDGFLRREAIAASLTPDEKREILRGMLLTRATDNRLKQFFTGGEVRWGNASFQGKGFRSLGQEAIYAAVIRLRREPFGDVISPMIRDLGAVLGMRNAPETVRMVLNAQMGKAGPPMNGRDLHVGDWEHGVLPAMAPLGSPALTIAGIAMAFKLRNEPRVAVSFIGEGATSLGEWHEAINACAARRLPAVFCIQNN